MNLRKFYTDNKFGLLIDLPSMTSQAMHTPREQDRQSPAGNRVGCQRLTHRQLPYICYLRLPVQQNGPPAGFCAVSNICLKKKKKDGPQQYPLQHANHGAHQVGKALSGAGFITSCSSVRQSLITRLFPAERDPRLFIIICVQHLVEVWLKMVSTYGTNTPIVLDDCAA